jgi:hypothetical protein
MLRQRVILLSIFLLGMRVCNGAGYLSNGLYRISADGVTLQAVDGSEIRLGERLNDFAGQAEMQSLDNKNSQFALILRQTGDLPNFRSIALLVDGHGVRFDAGGTGGGSSFLQASLPANPPQTMRAVARFFGIIPRVRARPPYSIAVAFVPTKPLFGADEPVSVTLNIQNVGKTTIVFQQGGSDRGPRDNQFGFTAQCPSGAPCDPLRMISLGGGLHKKTLKPGEVFAEVVDLRKWFTFVAPGIYRVTGTYRFPVLDERAADLDFFCVWLDKALAPFEISIR